jgi:alkylhydroperoxidase family enzyme
MNFAETFGLLPTTYARYAALEEQIWDGRIDHRLLEVCRLRIASLHRCQSELADQRADIGAQRRANIAQWPTSELFSPDEKALLRFTEQYVIDAEGVTDAEAAGVTSVLSGPEVAGFTTAIATFDAICRFKIALGI